MTIFAEDGASRFRLEGHGVVSAAIVANNLESSRGGLPGRGFLRTALWTTLGRHHVPLVVEILVFLRKDELIAALHAGNIDIGHKKRLLENAKFCFTGSVSRDV